jgi:FlgD Ig-like domain/Beta-propeller repeat
MRNAYLISVFVACLCLLGSKNAFSATPQLAWTASYNGPASYWEAVSDATVRDGFLYVVGFATLGDQTRGYITIKYASDGSEVWSRIYEGFVGSPNNGDQAAAVAVDTAGNVYVTGYSSQDSAGVKIYVDAATLKYSPAGDLLWERRFRGSGGNVQPSAIVVDPRGFVYVSGANWIDGGFDVFLLKYDLAGNLLWSRTRGQAGARWDAAFAMALDGNGDVVLGGYTQPGDLDVYVLKFAANGSFLWEWSLVGVANVEEVIDLTIDGDGNTYALAQYAPPGEYISLLTVKLSASGAMLWSDVYSGQSTGDYGAGIELAPDGTVFSAGAAWENGSQNGMTLIKYTSDGQRLWARSQRGGYYSAECNDVAVDADGAAYMTGFAFNENGREDYLTAKYDGSGNLAWVTAWNAPEGRSDTAYLVRVGIDRRVYVIGDAWRDFANYYDITSVVYSQDDPTGIEAAGAAPALSADRDIVAYPNPASVPVQIAFGVLTDRPLTLDVFDTSGRRVRSLVSGALPVGVHSTTWDRRDESGGEVSAGTYFLRMRSGIGYHVTERVTVVR